MPLAIDSDEELVVKVPTPIKDTPYFFLSLAGFEHTYVTRALLSELLGYEFPLERIFLEGDTAVIEVKNTPEARDAVESLVGTSGP